MMKLKLAPLALLLVSACATAQAERPKSASSKKPEVVRIPENPVPSAYAAYPGTPTVIRNVNIYDGAGAKFVGGAIRFQDGKIVTIGQSVDESGATVIDGAGKWVTPGIIDIHSHLGNYPSPGVAAHQDGNEITGPVRSEVHAEHGIWPQDPGFSRALVNGGVTSLHVLPGSANLFGGRGVTIKNVGARTMQAMKFPGAPYSLKMACGENPKRVYGGRNQMPGSRMGNMALNRQTWAKAIEYRRKWDDYTKRAEDGKAQPDDAPERNLQMETLVGVLEGDILVQNHCYRADEMANVIDMAKEFGYKVTTFHHAVESYKVADLLAREGICSAMWADWFGFKMESNDGIRENIPFVHATGACAIVHSDDANGIQRLNQEAAKALADGNRVGLAIAPETAWTWLAINPAKALGIADKTGSLAPGKMADVVLWNGDPLSVYSRPEKVWIDGALMVDIATGLKPVSDFELGQVGEGDPK
jgi:imidazolonepropionase-like amidohydrolase